MGDCRFLQGIEMTMPTSVDVVIFVSNNHSNEISRYIPSESRFTYHEETIIAGVPTFYATLQLNIDSSTKAGVTFAVAYLPSDHTATLTTIAVICHEFQPGLVVLCGLTCCKNSLAREGDVVICESVVKHSSQEQQLSIGQETSLRVVGSRLEPQYSFVNDVSNYLKLLVKQPHFNVSTFSPSGGGIDTDSPPHPSAIYSMPFLSFTDLTEDKYEKMSRDMALRYPTGWVVDIDGYCVADTCIDAGIKWLVMKVVCDGQGNGATRDHAVRHKTARRLGAYSQLISASVVERYLLDLLMTRVSVAHATMRAVSFADTSLPLVTINELEISRDILRDKLNLDFSRSVLFSRESVLGAHQTACQLVSGSGLLSSSGADKLLSATHDFFVPSGLHFSSITHDLEVLNRQPPFRVCCSAIYPGVAAALVMLRDDFKLPLNLEVLHSNSIEMIESLSRGKEYDIIFSAQDPFYIVGGSTKQKYQPLLPILSTPQWLYYGTKYGLSKNREVYVVPGSSGYTHYLSQKSGLLAGASVKEIDSLSILHRALNLGAGEMLAAWSPIASVLDRESSLSKMDESLYTIFVHAFPNVSNWLKTGASRAVMGSFLRCFIYAFNVASSARARCLELLAAEGQFMRTFQNGAGFRIR